MNKYISEVALKKALEHARESRCFIGYSSRFFTPKEFLLFAQKVSIEEEDIRFVSPSNVITNGKLKLYELLKKQVEFEKHAEDYLTGKID